MKFKRCPKVYLTEDVSVWLYAYKMFKNGFLPCAGGWLQQTYKFILIMGFIDNEMIKFQQSNGKTNAR